MLTFHLFSSLPLELQDHIWRLADLDDDVPNAYMATLEAFTNVAALANNDPDILPHAWERHRQFRLRRAVPPSFSAGMDDSLHRGTRAVLRRTCAGARRAVGLKAYPALHNHVELAQGDKTLEIDASKSLVVIEPQLRIEDFAEAHPGPNPTSEDADRLAASCSRLQYLGLLWSERMSSAGDGLGPGGLYNMILSFPDLQALFLIIHPSSMPASVIKAGPKKTASIDALLSTDGWDEPNPVFSFRWRDMDLFEVPWYVLGEEGREARVVQDFSHVQETAEDWEPLSSIKVKLMTWRVVPWDGKDGGKAEAERRSFWSCDGSGL